MSERVAAVTAVVGRPIAVDDVKLGMLVHSREWYDHGTVLTFTGYVQAIGREKDGRRFAQLRGLPYMGIEGRHPYRVDLYEVLDSGDDE